MALSALFQGVVIGGSMIIPIGAQNAYVLRQGIKRNHHILTASICIFCDVLLIALGVFGGGKLIASNDWLFLSITWGGISFLFVYGSLSLKSAWQNHYQNCTNGKAAKTRKKIIVTTLAVTLLNPHVYLDTIVILGSIGSQFKGAEQLYFALGTMLASIIWFYGLASSAAKMAPWLAQSKVQRIIDIIVAIIMYLVAISLFNHWYHN